MTIEHRNIVDPNVHEPKGASGAAAGTVYVSNGAGSGTWDLPEVQGQRNAAEGTSPVKVGGSVVWRSPEIQQVPYAVFRRTTRHTTGTSSAVVPLTSEFNSQGFSNNNGVVTVNQGGIYLVNVRDTGRTAATFLYNNVATTRTGVMRLSSGDNFRFRTNRYEGGFGVTFEAGPVALELVLLSPI